VRLFDDAPSSLELLIESFGLIVDTRGPEASKLLCSSAHTLSPSARHADIPGSHGAAAQFVRRLFRLALRVPTPASTTAPASTAPPLTPRTAADSPSSSHTLLCIAACRLLLKLVVVPEARSIFLQVVADHIAHNLWLTFSL
jgi:hypothetical protein